MLTPPKATKQIASLNKDLFLLSSLTFPKQAWTNNIAQILINADKNKGTDLIKSFNATSTEPLTIEPMISANAYNALKNVNDEKMKNKINKQETTKDCPL